MVNGKNRIRVSVDMKDRESLKLLTECRICPRNCGIDRYQETGVCGQGAGIQAARASLHMWEEPCISGERGSGTVFFTGCSMGCVFCQNRTISSRSQERIRSSHTSDTSVEVSNERLADIFLQLQEQGAHNINLVTPTHFIPQIAIAIDKAKQQKLNIPFVYNTSSYEKTESLKRLDGLIDIYLPDLKFMDPVLSQKYAKAQDYFQYASDAIEEMVRQIPRAVFDEEGMMEKGVIVRHMMLPDCYQDSKNVIRYLYERYHNQIYISIMNQYTPMPGLEDYPELKRRIRKREYDRLIDFALKLGVENGFIQEGNTALESFIPEFNGEGIRETYEF